MPSHLKYDVQSFENYLIVPKFAQSNIDQDFSLKVVVLALDDMTDIVIEHKFFGHKEKAVVKPFKPFEGVNYDMFRHI